MDTVMMSYKVRRVTLIVSLIVLFSLPNLSATAQSPWRILSRPTTNVLTKLSFLDSLTGFVAGKQGTIMKTTDGGSTWLNQNSNINTDIIDLFMLNDRYGWALSYVWFVDTSAWYGAIFLKTTNGGDTWLNEQFPVNEIYLKSVRFLDSLHGWVGGQSGSLLETSDGGTSWQRAAVDSSIFANLTVSKIRFYSSSVGLAVGGILDLAGVVWRTTNGGQRWTATGVSPEPVLDIHRIDSLNIIGVVGDLEYGAGVIRSTDGGDNWEYETLNIFGQPASLSFRTTTEAWSPLGFVQRLLYTKDTGTTWFTVKTPGLVTVFDLVFTDSTTGYAVGDSGVVLKYSPVVTGVQEIQSLTPAAAGLSQNYPNPFNPSTVINYTLPMQSTVTLTIYNVLGQEVIRLVDKNKNAGSYAARWDGVNAAGNPVTTGVYFYKLEARGTDGKTFHEVRRMLLLK